jgi:hypothetical protein
MVILRKLDGFFAITASYEKTTCLEPMRMLLLQVTLT